MIPFAVSVVGVTQEGKGKWVLAVSRESLLISHDDGTLHWHKLADCRLAAVRSPEIPQPVVAVQPKGAPVLHLPSNGMN